MVMRTSTALLTDARPAARGRAELALAGERLRAPASTANIARNARAEVGRHSRWAPARDALWRLLDPYLADGARVAILGAGNGDTIPLAPIAERAREIALIDLDEPAIRAARRRQPRGRRRRITTIEHDITHGAADQIAAAAARGTVPDAPVVPEAPLPGAPYDLVIGDLFYSQLLYPALIDLNIRRRTQSGVRPPLRARSNPSGRRAARDLGPERHGCPYPRPDRVVARTPAARHPRADPSGRRERPGRGAHPCRPWHRPALQRPAHCAA